eukprot:gb/GECG01007081.1/.p1 GENE.gb/GECG01007081.1/~~gb/GECG01007081.1/.p1  ORF type:complete len:175 (+),score=16.08 gb/GECG01007081.1/:1-525(+)
MHTLLQLEEYVRLLLFLKRFVLYGNVLKQKTRQMQKHARRQYFPAVAPRATGLRSEKQEHRLVQLSKEIDKCEFWKLVEEHGGKESIKAEALPSQVRARDFISARSSSTFYRMSNSFAGCERCVVSCNPSRETSFCGGDNDVGHSERGFKRDHPCKQRQHSMSRKESSCIAYCR